MPNYYTTLTGEISSYESQLNKAMKELEGLQTSLWNTGYKQMGLEGIKGQIGSLDAQITSEKNKRDEEIGWTKGIRGYSAATITGRTGKIQELANARINNLIGQRNSLAEQYNTTLGELTNKIARETADKQTAVENFRWNLQWRQGKLESYQQQQQAELAAAREESHWKQEFALELLKLKAEKPVKGEIKEYVVGGQRIRDVVDPYTGKVISHEVIGTSTMGELISEAKKAGKTREEVEQAYRAEGLYTDEVVRSLNAIYGTESPWERAYKWFRYRRTPLKPTTPASQFPGFPG